MLKPIGERNLKLGIGMFVVCINIVMIVVILVFFALGWFDSDQLTTLLAVVIPMFSCYASAATRYIAKERFTNSDAGKPVNWVFVVLSFAIPSLFALIIVLAIILQAKGDTFSSFERFKQILLILATLFASYMGQLIYAMFSRVDDEASSIVQGNG